MKKRQVGFMVEIALFWIFMFGILPLLVSMATESVWAGVGTFLAVFIAVWLSDGTDESTRE